MILISIATILMLTVAIRLWINTAPQFGGKITDEKRKAWSKYPHYDGRKFVNTETTTIRNPNVSMFKTLKTVLSEQKGKAPEDEINTLALDFSNSSNPVGINVIWFGHSTALIEINGIRLLTDPVFSKRTSPVKWAGTKQFNYSENYQASQLPIIDYVLISHDHFDHLDYHTIQSIDTKTGSFIVPLGVKPHLVRWGVDESKIIELNWWDELPLQNGKISCTPARHFSGRKGKDQFYTLWCSYVIEINGRKVYFSGDSGYGAHFKEIGQKYGPFDLTLLECGQYNKFWPLIHMQPEETAQAQRDLGGRYLLPIHWGKFKLSLHTWTEPVERLAIALVNDPVYLVTPQIGKQVNEQEFEQQVSWWSTPDVKPMPKPELAFQD